MFPGPNGSLECLAACEAQSGCNQVYVSDSCEDGHALVDNESSVISPTAKCAVRHYPPMQHRGLGRRQMLYAKRWGLESRPWRDDIILQQ